VASLDNNDARTGKAVSGLPPAEAPEAEAFFKYSVEPAWTHYPCEWKRPRFARIPHEVDWNKLLALRQQRQQARLVTAPRPNSSAARAVTAAPIGQEAGRSNGASPIKLDSTNISGAPPAPPDSGGE
jgi:hypothetical protein